MEGAKSYEGIDSYRRVEPLLNGGGTRLMIISPFISPYYSRMLLRAAGRKKIKIITSGSEINRNALKAMQYGRARGYAKVLLYLFVLAAILFYFGLYAFAAVAGAAFAAVLGLFVAGSRRKSPIDVKVMRDVFVHEKVYISDNRAVVGSANLTYSGMHRNLEHTEVIDDLQEVSRLASHFEKLWDSAG